MKKKAKKQALKVYDVTVEYTINNGEAKIRITASSAKEAERKAMSMYENDPAALGADTGLGDFSSCEIQEITVEDPDADYQ